MDDLFGISMTSIMLVLLALLAVCLLSVAWVAWRRPVIFKLGVRNIPRRRAQTSLIVVGLMLSTMIIAAALGTGDTIDYSMSADVYDNLGHVDELVVASQSDEATVDLEASIPFDAAALAAVDAAVAGDANVDGVLPVLEARGPITNGASSLAEPDVLMTGLDPARLEQFGGLKGTDGKTIDFAALGADGIVLSQALAEKLDAKNGDRITLYYANQPAERTVAAIASDAYLGGARRARTSGLTMPGLAMPLAALQDLTGQPGKLTSIAVSNTGGVRDSLEPTDAVVADLRASLAGQGLGVDPLKQDMVDTANSFATVFTGLFLVLGLF
ncbi:MAG: ABC transporter permease, partial [Chloroflexota bacterium]|nr:ABC transporter permease [Chloroflexota bacterium]